MGKAAATNTTTTIDPVGAKLEQATIYAAKQQFLSSTFNMGWRLAITVIIPIVAGVKIDEHFKISPLFTLVGLMLAVVAGSVAVWTTIKQVSKKQTDELSVNKTSKREAIV